MKKEILVIEDNTNNMKLVTHLLSVNGYEVLKAQNGKIGIDTARTSKPDLIITDIRMPVTDGLEVARTLKNDNTTRKIPIIALTSEAMNGAREKVVAAGCDDYLTKPIDIQKLLALVEKYTGEAL
jgi:CheY-like chemotaxis protein